jgi:flagellum-specific peptidoglycan hydrolase FlgJ
MLNRAQWTKANFPAAQRATAGTGIFPETLLAIAIVESQGKVGRAFFPGQAPLARMANNFFGIKADRNYSGPTIRMNTPRDAQPVSTFRRYSSFEDSISDFVKFLQNNRRYRNAGVFTAPNYQEQILAIARAGYAEAPNYAEVITKVADSVAKVAGKVAGALKKGLPGALIFAAIFFLSLHNEKARIL